MVMTIQDKRQLKYDRKQNQVNDIIDKKRLSKQVNETYLIAGNQKTVEFLDKLKSVGFEASTRAGLSIAVSDILIPDTKDTIIEAYKSENIVDGKILYLNKNRLDSNNILRFY